MDGQCLCLAHYNEARNALPTYQASAAPPPVTPDPGTRRKWGRRK